MEYQSDGLMARQRQAAAEAARIAALAELDCGFNSQLLCAERTLRGLARSLGRGTPPDAPRTFAPAVAAAALILTELAQLRAALARCPYARALADRLAAADQFITGGA